MFRTRWGHRSDATGRPKRNKASAIRFGREATEFMPSEIDAIGTPRQMTDEREAEDVEVSRPLGSRRRQDRNRPAHISATGSGRGVTRDNRSRTRADKRRE